MAQEPYLKHKEKLKENAKKSYVSYIGENGNFNEESYRDSLRSADTAEKLSSSDYGALSESLYQSGLSSSGYEDYLKTEAYRAAEKEKLTAQRKLKEGEYENIHGYEKYVSDYNSLQTKLSKSVIELIVENRGFDYDEAFKTAVDAGIGEDMAHYTASQGVALARRKAINDAITFAKLNGLSAYRAKKYAMDMGLEEFYAEEVYNAMATFTDVEKDYYSSMSPDGYYQYIMSQANK